MELYIREFNNINHTNFKLQDIFCTDCERGCNWPCVSPTLTKILSDALFPCIFDECNFKGALLDYQQHAKLCPFRPIICPIDKVKYKNASELIKHLSGHNDVKKIALESFSTTIELNSTKQKDGIILADYLHHYFVISVKFNEENLSICVGYHLPRASALKKTFSVVHAYNKGQISQKADMIPLATLFNCENNADNCVLFKTNLMPENATLTIHFSDFENVGIKLDDCPICLEQILGAIRLCKNAHAVCEPCATKITSCPICREKMIATKVDLRYILSDQSFSCLNADKGCCVILKLKERAEHNSVCSFRKLTCSDCKVDFVAHKLCTHFINKHTLLKNFSTVIWTFGDDSDESKFILYRSKVFCVRMKFDYESETLHFLAQLFNIDDNDDCASNYRYEINLMQGNYTIASVGNVCTSSTNKTKTISSNYTSTVYNSTINLSACKNFAFDDDDDVWTIACCYNIFYNQYRTPM